MLSFTVTSMHLLYQQSEVLFGHFMTTLNAAFESKLILEDEGYESGSENFNIPTPLKLPESTMFPVMNTSPLIPSLHAAQLPASHIASLFNVGYHTITLMMKKIPWLTFHLPTVLHLYRTPWVLHSSHLLNLSLPYVMT